jgi:hypothetical protein
MDTLFNAVSKWNGPHLQRYAQDKHHTQWWALALAALRNLKPKVRTTDINTTRLPPKVKDPVYNSPEFI